MVPRQRKLVSFNTKDGFQINGLFVAGEFQSEDDLYRTPVVLLVHGVLGHFLARGTPRLVPNALVDNGFSSLSINTRMGFMGQILGEGIFDESIFDIEAAVDYLCEEGFSNIFILGWSLGGNQSIYYATDRHNPRVKGMILEGCSYSLPLSHRNRLAKWNSIPSYDHIYEIAQKVLKPDPSDPRNDRVFITYRAWGPTFNPADAEMFTYRTWWFMRSPEANKAKTNEIIPDLDVPVLFIHGENDHLVSGEEPEALLAILKESGNSDSELIFIPDAKHDCMENPQVAISTITEWLKRF